MKKGGFGFPFIFALEDSMNSGKRLEKDIKSSVSKEPIYYLRLKDSPSSFGQDSNYVRFTGDNPYDILMFYQGYLFPTELKNTKNTSFSVQKDKTEPKKMIKYNQIKGLTEASGYEGVYAGFLFNFEEGNCYWVDIRNFVGFITQSSKKSVNEQDILQMNPIEIEKKKLKVNYRYSIKELLDKLIRKDGAKIATTDI